jgi:hypothetical protein
MTRALALCLGILVGSCTVGCGASPLRQHAMASRATMVMVEGAGLAIEQSTRAMLERCPDEDGEARTRCIDEVERVMVPAAAARDAAIAPAHAYRAAVQASDGEEAPGVVEYLGVVATSVARDVQPLADALRALGVPVPPIVFPEGAQ